MILGQVINPGEAVESEYPCVKRWQSYNTYALFSSSHRAMIIAADPSHEQDFVGKDVDDTSDPNWIRTEKFEIVISGE